MIIIRLATEEDIPRILELYQQLAITTSEVEGQRCLSLDDYQQVFGEISRFRGCELVVAEDHGEVIGSLVLVIVPNLSHGALPWAIIENVIVDRKQRRRGVGRQLMEYAITRAKESNCCRMGLISSKSRREAHHFYRALGFEASAEGFCRHF
jgi:L-amino acid N-acyltransferase YncA